MKKLLSIVVSLYCVLLRPLRHLPWRVCVCVCDYYQYYYCYLLLLLLYKANELTGSTHTHTQTPANTFFLPKTILWNTIIIFVDKKLSIPKIYIFIYIIYKDEEYVIPLTDRMPKNEGEEREGNRWRRRWKKRIDYGFVVLHLVLQTQSQLTWTLRSTHIHTHKQTIYKYMYPHDKRFIIIIIVVVFVTVLGMILIFSSNSSPLWLCVSVTLFTPVRCMIHGQSTQNQRDHSWHI